MALNNITKTEAIGPVGYLSVCLAHIRADHPLDGIEHGGIIAAPTQAEVDQARHMASVLAGLHPAGSEAS